MTRRTFFRSLILGSLTAPLVTRQAAAQEFVWSSGPAATLTVPDSLAAKWLAICDQTKREINRSIFDDAPGTAPASTLSAELEPEDFEYDW